MKKIIRPALSLICKKKSRFRGCISLFFGDNLLRLDNHGFDKKFRKTTWINFCLFEYINTKGEICQISIKGFKNHGDFDKCRWYCFYLFDLQLFLNIGNSDFFWKRT